MADSLIYQVSSRSDMLEEPFSRKDVVYVIDQNNQSYAGGQILLETSQLANSGRWASYSEAYLTIPLVLSYRGATDLTAQVFRGPYNLGLKNGFHQLIDSFSIDLNGTNVCQLTPYTNFFVSYKMMTSWAQEDIFKYGASTNFFPDDVFSVAYTTAAATTGNGVANNRVAVPSIDVLTGSGVYVISGFNSGFRNRLYNLNYPIAATAPATTVGALLNSGASLVGMNVWQADSGAGAARVYYSSVIAKIRLKDLHDFFAQVPLLKGAFFKMTFNVNMARVLITRAAGPVISVAATTDIVIQGRTNPLMVANAETGNPLAGLDGNLTIECAIGQSSLSAAASHASQRSCRLYVPLYTMQPSYEDQYLSMNPTKSIIYRDLYSYTIPALGSQSMTTNLLTNGLVAPKSLVIIPILNKAAGNNATVAFDPIASPFASEPATTSFGAALNQLNVQLSGVNVFQQNEQYDYEAFLNELSRINAVNGGQTTGLGSGLIDEYKFSTLYRYYVCDLSRGYSSEDMVPKSVQLSCTNVSQKILDLYCFIEYERKISVDLRTGQVVQV